MHYNDVIISALASQITSLTIVYSTVYSGADQIKHLSSATLAFVWGIRRWLINSPHKGPVMRKMLPFDDVIMDRVHPTKYTDSFVLCCESIIISNKIISKSSTICISVSTLALVRLPLCQWRYRKIYGRNWRVMHHKINTIPTTCLF